MSARGAGTGDAARAPRLVALRALGLGDLLTAVPALRALARAFPRHSRALAAPAPLAPLARLAGWPVVPVGELQPLPPALHGVDLLANLHGCGPQSHRLVLDARPERTIWYEHPDIGESAGSPRWVEREHEVERWCRLLRDHGIHADPRDLDLPAPPGRPPAAARGATVIHPGATSGARRWPLERFAAVARAEAAAGRRVVVTGSRAELPLARRLAARARLPDRAVLAGTTDLEGLARVVAAAARVVCGDTGVAHLATALATPSVVLFGPTSPAQWGPPHARARNRVLWSGRTGDPHARRPHPGLLQISPQDVLRELEQLPA
ncbi:MAG TPA: glycosyltransferase family 9 protein [Thermoleophilaceae bacterium]|nr:glycosyltransferase family 9 protein [Thermoleophilaceae bacterium]